MEILTVALIVIAAALVVGRRLVRAARTTEGAGGCGSCGEASCGACPSSSELVPLGRRSAGEEPPGPRSK